MCIIIIGGKVWILLIEPPKLGLIKVPKDIQQMRESVYKTLKFRVQCPGFPGFSKQA